jgi:hypothetical protein
MVRRQIPILSPIELERYLDKINITRNLDDCWEWTAAKIKKSDKLFYGTFKNNRYGSQHNAHLWAYRYFVGPLDLTLEIAHTCLNGLCCNWMRHLVQVDHSTNQYMTQDKKFEEGAVCGNGHPRTSENTYYDPRGWRECIPCRRGNVQRHRTQ